MEQKKIQKIMPLSGWQILTDKGFCDISHIAQTIPYKVWNIRTTNHSLKCADNHILYDKDMNEVFVCDVHVGDFIRTDTGLERVLYVYMENKEEPMYDMTVESSEHRYYTNGILSHNTSVCCAFVTHYILFNEEKKVAILANKLKQAQEILSRVQTAYIHLPKWLQVGVKSWGKQSIELENGSSILAAATSSDSVRGFSFSCVIMDEVAFVPKNLWSKFYTSTFPTISSGKKSKLILVSTPNGQNHFYDFWTKAKEGKNNLVPYEVNWWDVPGRDDAWRDSMLKEMSEEQFNVEYGNSFDTGANTLIAPYVFPRLAKNIKEPEQTSNTVKIYELPQHNHIYILSVDCSHGTGLDYSTISIIDITSYPYKQIATFRDNNISPMSFPQIIYQMGSRYNNAEVLIENNDIGSTILHILNYDLEYDNIVKTVNMQKFTLGQRTTIKTKSNGCSLLKDMIEGGQLIIEDNETLSELRHFALRGQSYAAETGYHDDLAMSLVNFAYYTSLPIFRMRYDDKFFAEYQKERETEIMETLSPLPIFANRLPDNDDDVSLKWLE